MALRYQLKAPIAVGSLTYQKTVSSLKLTSISINYQDVYASSGTAILSICLVDPDTGYPVNVVYQDASALALAQTIESQIGAELFQKLIADGKLPAGTLTDTQIPATVTPVLNNPAPSAAGAPAPTATSATSGSSSTLAQQ